MTFQVWLHWRKENGTVCPDNHMKLMYSGSMAEESQVSQLRLILKNLLEYALDKRLKGIKAALPLFDQNRSVQIRRSASQTTRSASQARSEQALPSPASSRTSAASTRALAKKARRGSAPTSHLSRPASINHDEDDEDVDELAH
jgi:hypothetical protein